MKCYVDNKFLIDSIYSTKTVTDKSFQIDICIVCEMIAKKENKLVEGWKSELQLADSSTKGTVNCIKLLNVLTGLLE